MKQEFIDMIAGLGDARFDGLIDALEQTAPEVSVRLNPAKMAPRCVEATEDAVAEKAIGEVSAQTSCNASVEENAGRISVSELVGCEAVAWEPESGRYLSERPRFTFDPAMHQGRYYVQDASSMVVKTIARCIARMVAEEYAATENGGADNAAENTAELNCGEESCADDNPAKEIPLLWLDACAAPGGKSTAAADGLPPMSMVVSNEYDYQRAEILKENLAKWGMPCSVVTRGDTSQYRRVAELFDVVAVDAPCSGEGMMRKDAAAVEQWTPALVRECSALQHEILDNLWEALRPGGYLVYSTCTFNTLEDEETLAWLRREKGAEIIPLKNLSPLFAGIDGAVAIDGSAEDENGICEDSKDKIAEEDALRFIPGRSRGEGLFIALLRKPGKLVPAILSMPASASGKKAKGKQPAAKGKGYSEKGKASAEKGKGYAEKGKGNRGKEGKSAAFSLDAGAVKMAFASARGMLAPEVADDYVTVMRDDRVVAFPRCWEGLLDRFDASLQVISAGVELGGLKGRDFIPSHQLALSTILRTDAFPRVELSLKEALEYLSREAVVLPDDSPKGYLLLTWERYPLGFVKNIGNRCNNLYPKEWRIKSKL